MVKVLFVCTGNICRSPTAEGVFRARVAAAGLAGRVRTDSAGTHGYHIGEPPDPRSIRAALARGVDISDLRARRVTAQDFRSFDLLLAMDRDHYSILQRQKPPSAMAEIRMFLDYASRAPENGNVPDPYYGGHDGFDHVLDLIEDASDGLLADVRRRLSA